MKHSYGILSVFVFAAMPALAGAQPGNNQASAPQTDQDQNSQAEQAQGQQGRSGNGNVIDIRVSRTIQAVNYRANTGTEIKFDGTPLMPRGDGKAHVEAKNGRVAIKAEFDNMEPPTSFGVPYLTYVLWAISPEGQPNNLGELVLEGKKTKIEATTELQTFGMMVTAEPYFGVTFPSDVVVVQNVVTKNTKGAVTEVDAKYDLLQRGRYSSLHMAALPNDPKAPLALEEARNAVRIAEAQQAAKYAPESWAKAQAALRQAQDYEKRKQKQPTLTASRNAVQAAEDARAIAVKRAEDERVAQQQQEAAQAAAQARAEQEQEAAKRAQAEEQKAQAEAAAAQAAQQQAQAEADRQAEAARAQQAQQQAEQAAERQRQAEQQAQQQAQQAAEQQRQAQQAAEQAAAQQRQAQEQAAQAAQQAQASQQQAEQAEREKEQLRQKLLAQFNQILVTKDTPRGLVVSMNDVLFETARYSLKDQARVDLARLAGIVVNYPGLKLQVEGYTDSRGTQEFNQKLSEERANAVKIFLISQGVNLQNVSAMGLGENNPVADNGTPDGRQKNRRVEIVVSGDVIGAQVGQNH